jgi:glutamate dehydrogenase
LLQARRLGIMVGMPSTPAPVSTATPSATTILAELSREFQATAEHVVPWFLGQMPPMYFQDTAPEAVRSHLRAIIAAKASGAPLDLTLRSEDGREVTSIRPGNRVGVLAEIVGALPLEPSLRAAKIHASADGSIVLDTFEFGERTPFNPKDKAQADRVETALRWAREHGLDWNEAEIRTYASNAPADYIGTLTPLRLSKHLSLFQRVSGSDGTVVELEPESEPTHSRITIAFSNARTRTMLERVAFLLSAARVSIQRAYLDQVKDPPHGSVTFLGFVVQTEDGKSIDPKGELWKRVSSELMRVKWLDFDTLKFAARHAGIGLARAEALTAFCHLVHQTLVHRDRLAYSFSRILAAVEAAMPLAVKVIDLFMARFHPEATMDDGAFSRTAAALRGEIESHRSPDGGALILGRMLDAVEATLRTNCFLPARFGFALRLDPALLKDEQRPELPWGAFFVHGRGYNGFHVRFKEIARGGLRVIRPRDASQHAREADKLYDEVYGLSFAQQQKNKDIPEGGAKCAILVEPAADPTRCVKSFVNSILDLITAEPATRARIVDRLGRQEFIYLGPDENITPDHIEWIVARARRRQYALPTAFMSSKPGAGINHKVYGVTSEGVNVFLEVALKAVGIDPRKQPFTVKITGGPDGDVAGNMMRILDRDYGANARIVGVADGSGVGEDPDGLDHAELLRLFKEGLPIASFSKAKLGKRGRVVSVDEPDGARLRNTLHNRLITDAFVPGGGRPATIDDKNWSEFLTSDGVPSSKVISEGANLFLTPEARRQLSARGAVIIKDSTANKCGVICSSYEIQACMLLSDEAFLKIKAPYVDEVLEKLRGFARSEAELLMAEGRRHPTVPLPELSVRISKAINATADTIHASMSRWSEADRLLARTLVLEHLPTTLVKTVGERLWKDLPAPYVEWLISKRLASTIVYREGVDFLSGMEPEAAASTALRYLQRSQDTLRLVAALKAGSLNEADRATVAKLLERSGTRGALLD